MYLAHYFLIQEYSVCEQLCVIHPHVRASRLLFGNIKLPSTNRTPIFKKSGLSYHVFI